MREDRGSVTCYVRTESGVAAFATSSTDTHGNNIERLLTPLEALRIFQAELDTPTAPLRTDHFDRQKSLLLGPLTTDAITQGNLKGIRKWVWERLGGDTLYSVSAGDALNALYERSLTTHAKQRLIQARKSRYSLDDLADLIRQLHEEDRLVIQATENDEIRIVCSLGVQDAHA